MRILCGKFLRWGVIDCGMGGASLVAANDQSIAEDPIAEDCYWQVNNGYRLLVSSESTLSGDLT